MPSSGIPAANTAAPHPPSTSHNVPRNSAANFLIIVSPRNGRLKIRRHGTPKRTAAALLRPPSYRINVIMLRRVRHRQVEAVQVHHLCPCRDEVLHELLLGVA